MRVAEIAELLSAEVSGELSREIQGASELSSAGPADIAFAESDRALASAPRGVGCVLVAVNADAPVALTVLRVANPRSAFARVLRVLYAPRPKAPGVHPTAQVAASAQLGTGVRVAAGAVIWDGAVVGDGVDVGEYCYIGRETSIGAGGWLGPRVTVMDGVTVGARAVLHTGCVLGADGFGLAFEGDHYEKFPQVGTVEIGDDVEIGANSCVDRAALGATTIGDGTKLDNLVHIAHNCTIGKHVVMAAQTGISGGVVVEDYVVIGGQVGIADKARIGTQAILGAQAGIVSNQKLDGGATYWGTPARPHKQHLRKLAALEKLPETLAEIKRLRQRIEELEGQA